MDLLSPTTPIRRFSDEWLMRFYFASSGGPPKGGLYFWKLFVCHGRVGRFCAAKTE